ncbi:DUF2752 domain-containing protein [Cuneatibacter caecimuris]|uniref:Uncharacterized protein DUF2752 n=1 Tax=Cuneatibacter caecimuris TaxID=1796618 RepID=A0A4Q7PKD4_9FIRM|nr:DUF2752 domain-containing protein [Cuneatibacter caecimuris]RZT00738.1 uncharacterized protein DUF2752 [Cuneatibacter caecimuris]
MKKLILQPAERDVRMEETLYRLLTAFLAAGLLGAGVIWLFRLDLSPFLLPCALRTWLGIYCPGCGGSRSFRFLLHGQILQSLFYHPLVPYGAAVCGWYWITHTLRHLTRGRIKGMRYRNLYCYLAVAIVILNFIWKNVMLLAFHMELIP